MRPLPFRMALGAGALALVAVLAAVLASGSWRGDFRIDESHKIGETAFLRLWMRGDVGNAAWFTNICDRTNMPFGKYAYGAAILLTGGTLPSLPTLAARGHYEAVHSPVLSEPYRPFLIATRSVSAVATALTAAVLITLLAAYHGWFSAAVAFAFLTLSSLTTSFWATAVFDPLFALLFMIVIALMASLADVTSARLIAAISAGVGFAAALAFQTRFNGLFAFMICVPFMAVMLRRDFRKAVLAVGIATGVLIVTALAINPLYWSSPDAVLEPFSGHDGWTRPAQRILQQKHDLETIALPLQEGRTEAMTVAAKFRYLGEMVMSDLAGLLMVISAGIGVILFFVRWRVLTPELRIALLMSLAVVATMITTLPLPWSRYLLVVIAPLALVGGFAAGELLRLLISHWRQAVLAARKTPSSP